MDATPTDDLLGVYDPLTVEQCLAVNDLRRCFESAAAENPLPVSFTELLDSNPTLFYVRFLFARKWVVEDALLMIREAAAWRIENELETTPLFPAATVVRRFDQQALEEFQGFGPRQPGFLDAVASQFRSTGSSAWHGVDKGGRPLYIERTGHIRPEELVKRCRALVKPGGDIAEPLLKLHIHNTEVGCQIMRYLNAKYVATGRRKVEQVTVIMDCDGLGLRHFYAPALDILKKSTTVDQKYYAEGMHRLYVANTPTIVSVGWSIVKRWVDVRIQKKVVFLKPGEETRAALREAIPLEYLPAFLGGECSSCKNECVPCVIECSGDSDHASTETIAVLAGTVEERRVPVTAGSTVAWSFVVVQHNILFTAEFVAEGAPADSPRDFIREPADDGDRINGNEASYDARVRGVVLFKFDNTYSWRTAKEVHFRAEVIALEA